MRDKQETIERILECGIAAVVRGESDELIIKAIEAALAGGVNIIEVTFTVPNPPKIIRSLAAKVSRDVVLGAGTVLTPQMAQDAIDAGARFIVSPITSLDVIEVAKTKGVPAIPGALTPTEVVMGWQVGAEIIKIFPANVMGPGYLKDLHGPLPQIKLMPTGGVTLDTAQEYLKNGAAALGVGGDLISKKLMEEGNFEEIKRRAQSFRKIVEEFRAG